MRRTHRFPLFFLLLALATVGGCGRRTGADASQVAAQVNSDEITVHEVNYLLAQSPAAAPESAGRLKREALDRLINQQLAVQQAMKRKLDRSPAVLEALEFARNETLARAFYAQVAAGQPKPTAAEVKTYYAAHPELFAQRRLYLMEEFTVAAKSGEAAGLSAVAASARSIQDVADWLKARGIQYGLTRGARAAEQVPLELLPALKTMRDGQIKAVGLGGGRMGVVHVIESRAAPVDEETAAPRIERYLSNTRTTQAIADVARRLKLGAKIEYRGEFAAGQAAGGNVASASEAAPGGDSGAAINGGIRGIPPK